jgi:hypothetical protein
MSELLRIDDFNTLRIWTQPRFEDFHQSAFRAYPYIELASWCGEPLVVIGTLSGKTLDGRLVRRGCVVNEVPFGDTAAYATLKREQQGVRRTIKVLHRHDMTVRWFTSVDREDAPEWNRVVAVVGDRLSDITATYAIPSHVRPKAKRAGSPTAGPPEEACARARRLSPGPGVLTLRNPGQGGA